MTSHPAYYSIIQYCPDPSRAEAANVGVLLFCPTLSTLDSRLAHGNDRIRRIFGVKGSVLDEINSAKQSLQDRIELLRDEIKTVEELQQFIDTRANDLKITSLRSMKVEDPSVEIDKLFEECVGGRIRRMDTQKNSLAAIDQQFRRPSLKNRIRYNVRVQLPIFGREVEFQYAFNYGVENLIKPQQFREGAYSIERAKSLACEGDLLQRPQQDETGIRQVIIIPMIDEDASGKVRRSQIEEIFNRYKIRTVFPNALPQFVEEIEQIAH